MRYNEINSIINGLFKPSTRDDLSHLCSSLCIARGFSAMRASRWPNPSNWRVWNTSVQEKHGETIHVNSIDTKSPSVENNMPNFIEQNTPSYHISAQPFLLTSPGFTPLVSLSHPFQLGVQCSNDSNASSFFYVFYTSFSKAHDAQGHHENGYQRRSIFRMAGLLQLPLPVRPANDDLRLVDPVQVNQL